MSEASEPPGPFRAQTTPADRLGEPLRVALAGLATVAADVVAVDGTADETAHVLRALQGATEALLARIPTPAEDERATTASSSSSSPATNVIDFAQRQRERP